jgi:hypothetical membrane protein
MEWRAGMSWAARVGALSWIACIQFFVAEQVVRLAWTFPYSFTTNYVSDLGASVCSASICSPWHRVMNASFALQGVLIAGGAILTWRQWPAVGRIGLGLLQVCGVGVIVVGLVPEDTDAGLHRFGAALHFLGGGLAMIAIGSTLRRSFGWISVGVGIAVVAAAAELGKGGGTPGQDIGMGALERIAAYGIAGWMVVLGVWSYFLNASSNSGPGSLGGPGGLPGSVR